MPYVVPWPGADARSHVVSSGAGSEVSTRRITSSHESAPLSTEKQNTDTDVAYVMRLATVYLAVDRDTNEGSEYASRIAESLEEDARVTHANAPDPDPDWSPEFTAYLPIDETDDGVLEATRHFHVQRFSEPIGIHLRVPLKNQPKVFDTDRIPSEHYFALWDGVSLLVGWEQPALVHVGSSGGHIIEAILGEAAERVGASIVVQACNPECTYVFLHTAIRATVDDAVPSGWSVSLHPQDSSLLEVVMDEADDLVDACLNTWWKVCGALDAFAEMKNRGRQILELEHVVRRDLDQVNQLHHHRASAAQKGILKRARAAWEYRSWRRTSRYYLARLWLGLGSLEWLRRQWADSAFKYRRIAGEENLNDLFAIDVRDEVNVVEQLDLTLVEAAVEHAEDRISANLLALATAGGAIAGAIVAAIITAA